jgi:Acyl-CoA reductase (LuxC)
MTQELPRAYWISPEMQAAIDTVPGGSIRFIKEYDRGSEKIAVDFLRLSPEALELLTRLLREKRDKILARRNVRDIVHVLDKVAKKWLSASYAPRETAIQGISAITGFSPEMVEHSIYLEQVSSQGPHLLHALENELGNPSYLDDFLLNDNLGGYSRAVGPELVGAIFSSNIPALPHLEVMRAFLVKAACLGRVSAGEPLFLALYAQSLFEIDPELASCLAVVYWERGDLETESAFLQNIDYLVAYGGETQTQRLLSAKPPGLEATWHGHKLGFSYICRDALGRKGVQELARKVAYDFSIFDGFACLCPQVCLVERNGEVSPLEFARACSTEMEYWARKLPPRCLEFSDAAHKYRRRELLFMRESMNDKFQVIAAPDDYSFTVVLEETDCFEPTSGDRFLKVVPVNDFADVESMIKPLGKSYLQCAAVATEETCFFELRRSLARWGVSRVVRPGIMATPSMMWHHDGVSCLGKMVTWCDHELMLPEELLAQ